MNPSRLIARALFVGGVVVSLLGVHAAPSGATANAGVAVVQGSGTITPGLNVVPAFQSFTFTSVSITTVGVVRKAPVVLGNSTCGASGSSLIPETVAVGAGTGGWSCTGGPMAGKSGALTYVREGAAVEVVLTAGTAQVGALACVFVSTSGIPVTSYLLVCAGAAGGVK